MQRNSQHNELYVHAGSTTFNAQISAGRDIGDDGDLHTEAHPLGWIYGPWYLSTVRQGSQVLYHMLAIYALQAFFSDTLKFSQKLILTDFS